MLRVIGLKILGREGHLTFFFSFWGGGGGGGVPSEMPFKMHKMIYFPETRKKTPRFHPKHMCFLFGLI